MAIAQPHPSDSDRVVTLISLLRRVSKGMVDEITERMEAAGYPDAPARHHPVFENLDRAGTRVTVLAERAGMSHQAMGELVQELVDRGIVERAVDPSDGRARLVRLTSQGQDVVRASIEHIFDIEAAWLARFQAAGLRGDLRRALNEALAAVDVVT